MKYLFGGPCLNSFFIKIGSTNPNLTSMFKASLTDQCEFPARLAIVSGVKGLSLILFQYFILALVYILFLYPLINYFHCLSESMNILCNIA